MDLNKHVKLGNRNLNQFGMVDSKQSFKYIFLERILVFIIELLFFQLNAGEMSQIHMY